jgi:hypothetical protein
MPSRIYHTNFHQAEQIYPGAEEAAIPSPDLKSRLK